MAYQLPNTGILSPDYLQSSGILSLISGLSQPQQPNPQAPPAPQALPPMGAVTSDPQAPPLLAATQGNIPLAPMPDMQADAEAPVKPKHTGFLHRPGMSAALAALGAGLLSGDSFGHGLARGITGYHQALQDEKDRNLPSVTPLMNGAFAMVKRPDGTYGVQKVDQVADYQMDLEAGKYSQKEKLAKLQGGIRADQNDSNHDWQSKENALNRQATAANLQEQIDARREQSRQMMDLRRDLFNQGQRNRQIPQRALQQYSEHLDNIGNTDQTLAMIEPVQSAISSGKLKLSYLDNLRHEATISGVPGAASLDDPEQAQMYGQYKQAVEYVRNNFLSLQKGVQTEGDAVRALNAIVSGRGYGPSVVQNLQTFINGMKRAKARNEREAAVIANTYGIEDPGDEYNDAPMDLPHNRGGGGGGGNSHTPRQGGASYSVGQSATGPNGQKVYWNGFSWTPKRP